MTKPGHDSELMSVFTLDDDDEENSDEEYFPWNLSGKMLQDVESPYDKAMRIQLANRELFSQPTGKKKHLNRVKFNLLPKAIIVDEWGKVTEENIEDMASNSKMLQKRRAKDLYRRRQTPPLILPPRASLCDAGGGQQRLSPCSLERQPSSNKPSAQNKDNKRS